MRQFLNRHLGMSVSVALFLIASFLGFVGWCLSDPDIGALEAIYRTMGLFAIDGQVPDTANPWLWWARYLAPLATLSGFVVIFLKAIGVQYSLWRAVRMKDHVVVLGAGPEAVAIACEFRQRSETVWVGEASQDQEAQLREVGVVVVRAASNRMLARVVKRADVVVITAPGDKEASRLTSQIQKMNQEWQTRTSRSHRDPAVITLLDSRDMMLDWRRALSAKTIRGQAGMPREACPSVENDMVVCRSEHVATSVLRKEPPYDEDKVSGWPIVLGDGRLAAELVGRIFEEWQQPGESVTVHWGGPAQAHRFFAERGLVVTAPPQEMPGAAARSARRQRTWPPRKNRDALGVVRPPSEVQGFGSMYWHEVPTGTPLAVKRVEDILRNWEQAWAGFPERGRYSTGVPRVYVAYEDDEFVLPLANALQQSLGERVKVVPVPADDGVAAHLFDGNSEYATSQAMLCTPDHLRRSSDEDIKEELRAEVKRWPGPGGESLGSLGISVAVLVNNIDRLARAAGMRVLPASVGTAEVTVMTPCELLAISDAMHDLLKVTPSWSQTTQLIELAGRLPVVLRRARLVLVRDDAASDPILVEQVRPLARLVHLNYQETAKKTGNATRSVASSISWEKLPELEQNSNVAQVLDIPVKLALLGLRLERKPNADEAEGELAAKESEGQAAYAFSPEEIELLAYQEHRRWRHFQLRNGRREHCWNIPWEMVKDETREQDRRAVQLIPTLLDEVGLMMVAGEPRRELPSGRPETKAPRGTFKRNGKARAVRLDAPRTWTSNKGDRLQAQAGDWWVMTGEGRSLDERSVDPESFARTYELIGGSTYERKGEVEARQVLEEETVETREGAAIARFRDWIVTDDAGASWPVPGHAFGNLYEPVVNR